jgi:hypothetical protein
MTIAIVDLATIEQGQMNKNGTVAPRQLIEIGD